MPCKKVEFLFRSVMLAVISILSLPVFTQVPAKKALLIGVGKYPVEGGWAQLSSVNDVNLLKSTLINSGFVEKDIFTLTDAAATKSGILTTLDQKVLPTLKSSDILYIHFSGHGQQKMDVDGDEIDGLDECIVPYDSPKKYTPGIYEGGNLVSDDELNDYLTKIRQKIGSEGQVFVTIDACHSGTGTRSMAVSRGSTTVMASEDYQQKNRKLVSNKEILTFATSETQTTLAPLVSFFGASQHQLNYEMTTPTGEHYGSLSYALSNSFAQADHKISFRSLFAKVNIAMSAIAPLQQPQSEGSLDALTFNGGLAQKVSYFLPIERIDDTTIKINGGNLHGLAEGAKIAMYKEDTQDIQSAQPINTGKVTKVMTSTSLVLLDQPLKDGTEKNTWIVVTEIGIGKTLLAVGTQGVDKDLQDRIRTYFSKNTFIQWDNPLPSLIFDLKKKNSNDSNLLLKTSNGYVLDSLPIMDGAIDTKGMQQLERSLRKYVQGDMIRGLTLEGSDISAIFDIIPYTGQTSGDALLPLQADIDGKRKMKLGSKFQVLIKNTGIKPAYFTLLDIQPDNIINVLLPSGLYEEEEMRVLPDQQVLIPIIFESGHPVGNELFKLIATDKPLDLKTPLQTRKNTQPSAFEVLFQQPMQDGDTGVKNIKSIGAKDIHIYSETFVITE